MPLRRLLVHSLVVVAAGVGLAACQTRVETVVEGDTDRVRISVSFQGDGLEIDAAQQQRLTEVLEQRSGVKAERSDDGKRFWIDVPVAALAAHAGVTGVESVQLSRNEEVATVRATLVSPAELIAAVAAGVKGQQDEDALLAAALGSTEVGVTVRMGQIDAAAFLDAQGVQQPVTVQDGVAEWYFNLSEVRTGVLEVSGRDATGRGVNVRALIAAALLFAAIGVAVRRRR